MGLFLPKRTMATHPISKKRKFVADGVFKAELNRLLTEELAEDGYSGVEVRVTPTRTEIIIMAARTQNVLGEKGRRIKELTNAVQKRFSFPEGSVELLPRRWPPGVSAPSLKPSLSDTSLSVVWPSEGPATVCSVSSWRAAPRVARLSFPASCAVRGPRP